MIALKLEHLFPQMLFEVPVPHGLGPFLLMQLLNEGHNETCKLYQKTSTSLPPTRS